MDREGRKTHCQHLAEVGFTLSPSARTGLSDFYANNGNNETTGPAVEKTDRLITEYGNQIEAWCAANADVNLAGDGSTDPTVWATEGP
jgi:hypothetical protein